MAEKNTTSQGADLTQDPNDFLAIAMGTKEVETVTPPVEPPKESAAETPPLPKAEAPRDNADKPADEKKPVEETPPEPKTPNVEPPKAEDKLTPEEYRQREASRMIQRQGEERKRAMMAHVEAARANPEHINTLIKYDKKLANEVVKEVWGYQDYDELIAQSKLAELKEADPEGAVVEERILKLELEAKRQSATAKEQLEKSFFTQKGFIPTEFDPRYVKVIEKLSLLNPTFVASDYPAALAEAYRMATGEEVVDASKDKMREALEKSAPSSAPASIKEPHSSPSSYGEATTGFANLMGVKIE
jgi:hypothetical protein